MSKSELAAGRFDPEPTLSQVNITAQLDDKFESARYDGVGVYNVTLREDHDVEGANDAFWTGTAFSPGHSLTLQPGFSDGKATVGVQIVDTTGAHVEDSFFLFAAFKK